MVGRRGKARQIGIVPEYVGFVPDGIPTGEEVVLTLDELETIRLLDLEKLSQEQAAGRMGVARTTVTSIYDRARTKVADTLINGKKLLIEGGNVVFRPACGNGSHTVVSSKKETIMRIAVTYDNGQIFQHFGKTQEFKLYDIEDGKVASSQVVDNNGAGHAALATFLKDNGVDTVICGGIGGGAVNALASAGITLYGGATGAADDAVDSLLAGTLENVASSSCGHGHGHGHGGGHGHGHGGGCHHSDGEGHHGHHGHGEGGCGCHGEGHGHHHEGHHGHGEGGCGCHGNNAE